MTKENKGKLYIFIAAVLWSLGGVLIKVVPWSTFGIIGVRSFLCFIVLYLYRGFDKKFKVNKVIFWAAVCASLTNFLFVYANKLTTAANAIVLQSTAPIFVVLISVLFLKKKPTKNQFYTIAIAFLGIIIFFMDQITFGELIGNILALLSGVSYAGMFFFYSCEGSNSLDSSILSQAMNVIIALPVLINFNQPALTPIGIFALIALGVVQLGISYIFFSEGIVLCDSISASLISMAEAVLNPIWVAIFIKEIPSIYSLVGGVIVLLSVVFNIIKKD